MIDLERSDQGIRPAGPIDLEKSDALATRFVAHAFYAMEFFEFHTPAYILALNARVRELEGIISGKTMFDAAEVARADERRKVLEFIKDSSQGRRQLDLRYHEGMLYYVATWLESHWAKEQEEIQSIHGP